MYDCRLGSRSLIKKGAVRRARQSSRTAAWASAAARACGGRESSGRLYRRSMAAACSHSATRRAFPSRDRCAKTNSASSAVEAASLARTSDSVPSGPLKMRWESSVWLFTSRSRVGTGILAPRSAADGSFSGAEAGCLPPPGAAAASSAVSSEIPEIGSSLAVRVSTRSASTMLCSHWCASHSTSGDASALQGKLVWAGGEGGHDEPPQAGGTFALPSCGVGSRVLSGSSGMATIPAEALRLPRARSDSPAPAEVVFSPEEVAPADEEDAAPPPPNFAARSFSTCGWTSSLSMYASHAWHQTERSLSESIR
mmetsp:Transcript_563/g.1659  ORF Transcript_563/g.1659 Transcript_563/m.1659 type:complete len:311 (+) Transcript_563:1901-2833(+)